MSDVAEKPKILKKSWYLRSRVIAVTGLAIIFLFTNDICLTRSPFKTRNVVATYIIIWAFNFSEFYANPPLKNETL